MKNELRPLYWPNAQRFDGGLHAKTSRRDESQVRIPNPKADVSTSAAYGTVPDTFFALIPAIKRCSARTTGAL
jgi:hypothetical protein